MADELDFCENCIVVLEDGEGRVTDDQVLLCAECFRKLSEERADG